MLSEEVIEKVIARLTERIEQGNAYVLEQIGKSIKKLGTLTPTKAYQLGQILKYGGDYNKITKKLAEITKLNVNDIKKIFEEVAKDDYQFAKQFYEYRGQKFIPYQDNLALKTQVDALANITAREYVNFSRNLAFTKTINGKTIATPLAEAYREAIDTAILSVAQGKESFDSQMYSTLKELASSGLKTVQYESGRTIRLDSAVRSHMRGALRDLHNEQQQLLGKEFNADGVEITVHLNPAPDHALVQGKQFSNAEFYKFQHDIDCYSYDKEFFPAEYEDRDRRSISQYNCYHNIRAIILGVSKPQYTKEQLQQILQDNIKGFEFDGKHYTNYEGTQLQRQLETEIRKQKDIQIIGKASGNAELVGESQRNIKMLSDKYNRLSQLSGLPTRADRLRVQDYRRVITTPNYMNIDVTKNRKLYNTIKNEKQIFHSTNSLRELFETEEVDINLQVLDKNKKTVNYGYEGVYLKPEALNYSVKLYNGDRGNQFTAAREEALREKNIFNFIEKAGKEHMYSTSIVRKMPIIQNATEIITYKGSPNYEFLKRVAKRYKIKFTEYNKR